MYPTIALTDTISVHTFGISIVFAGAIFFSLLHTLSLRKGLVQHIFVDLFSFIIVPFLFGRFFHLLAEWREEQFLFKDLVEGVGFFHFMSRLFLTENYNLSFAGCIIGFLVVFYIKTRKNKSELGLYYDALIPSFFAASLVGYFGALLGGQIYGIPFDGFFSIVYTAKDSIVPFRSPLFALPVLYMIGVLLICLYLYRISQKGNILPDGFIGYLGIGLYGILLFLAEFLNGSDDMLSSSFIGINFTQVIGLYFIGLAFIGLGKSLKLENL